MDARRMIANMVLGMAASAKAVKNFATYSSENVEELAKENGVPIELVNGKVQDLYERAEVLALAILALNDPIVLRVISREMENADLGTMTTTSEPHDRN